MEVVVLKRCKDCNEEKGMQFFGKNVSCKDGHNSFCKVCQYQRYKRPKKFITISEKECNQCHQTKLIDFFAVNNTRPDGRLAACKECRNSAARNKPKVIKRTTFDKIMGTWDNTTHVESVKKLPVCRGTELGAEIIGFVYIDIEKYDYCSKIMWCKTPQGYVVGGMTRYAFKRLGTRRPEKQKHLRLHRLVINCSPDKLSDHISGNKRDCRGVNLREATNSLNTTNSVKRANPTSSSFKGITWRPARGLWQASVMINSTTRSLGYFNSEVSAAQAYDKGVREVYGTYGRYNFPKNGERSALTFRKTFSGTNVLSFIRLYDKK